MVTRGETRAAGQRVSGHADPELLAYEDGIISRLIGPPRELAAWVLFAPYAQKIALSAARRFRAFGDPEDIAQDARLILLRSLARPTGPVAKWNSNRRGTGFWPTVFRRKVHKAVERALKRATLFRQVVLDQGECERAAARADEDLRELRAELGRAMSRLDPLHRSVFQGIYVENTPRSKLRRELGGVTHEQVERVRREAISALRQMLNCFRDAV